MWAFFDEKTNVFPFYSCFRRILEVEDTKGGKHMKELIDSLETKQQALEQLKDLIQKGDITSLLDIFQLKVDNKQAVYFLDSTQEICQTILTYLHEHVVCEPFYCKIPTTTNTRELYIYHREDDRMHAILNLKDRDVYHISSINRLHFKHVRDIWVSKNNLQAVEQAYQKQKEKTEKEWKWKKKITLPKKRKKLENQINNYFYCREELIRLRKEEYEADKKRYEENTTSNYYKTYQNDMKQLLQNLKKLGFQYNYIDEQEKKTYQLFHTQQKNTSYDLDHCYSHDYFHCICLEEYGEKNNELSEIIFSKDMVERCIREWKNMFGEEHVSDLTEIKNGIFTVTITSPKGTLTFSSDGMAVVTGEDNSIYPYVENETIHDVLFGKREYN